MFWTLGCGARRPSRAAWLNRSTAAAGRYHASPIRVGAQIIPMRIHIWKLATSVSQKSRNSSSGTMSLGGFDLRPLARLGGTFGFRPFSNRLIQVVTLIRSISAGFLQARPAQDRASIGRRIPMRALQNRTPGLRATAPATANKSAMIATAVLFRAPPKIARRFCAGADFRLPPSIPAARVPARPSFAEREGSRKSLAHEHSKRAPAPQIVPALPVIPRDLESSA